MRAIGIDIGTAITGWSILSKHGSGLAVEGYGVITTDAKHSMPTRLGQIYEGIIELIEKYNPDQMAIEDLFFFKNQKTVIKVGQARGVVIVAGVNKGLEVFDYTPLQVKQAVTGYGRADKKQVQNMVKMLLGLDEIPKPDDAADALAVGVCHLNSVR